MNGCSIMEQSRTQARYKNIVCFVRCCIYFLSGIEYFYMPQFTIDCEHCLPSSLIYEFFISRTNTTTKKPKIIYIFIAFETRAIQTIIIMLYKIACLSVAGPIINWFFVVVVFVIGLRRLLPLLCVDSGVLSCELMPFVIHIERVKQHESTMNIHI